MRAKKLFLQMCLWLAATMAPLGASASLITAGAPMTTVPGSLYDPLSTLSSPLLGGAFVVAIAVTGANDLQDWTFDLEFDSLVAKPHDVFGLYGSVYQAYFSAMDGLSAVTSSGFLLGNQLQGVAGFSEGVNGDGLLAYVLFQYVTGQEGNDPRIRVPQVGAPNAVPEPGSLALVIPGLVAGLIPMLRRRRRSVGRDRGKEALPR